MLSGSISCKSISSPADDGLYFPLPYAARISLQIRVKLRAGVLFYLAHAYGTEYELLYDREEIIASKASAIHSIPRGDRYILTGYASPDSLCRPSARDGLLTAGIT